MAEEFFMFDSVNNDREVTAEDFAKYFHEVLTNGVFYRNNLPSLKVSKGAGLISSVEIGAAFIEGYLYRNTAPITLTHASGNPSFPRVDRVVVRLNRNIANRDIRIMIKPGIPATNPLPPALERNNIIYELSLAHVRINAGASTISTVIDERLSQDLCGIVSSIVQPPTDVYQKEWDDFLKSIQLGAPALGGMTISVQSTAPTNPKNRDIWIDTR